MGRDIGRYCIFKTQFLAVNPTDGELSIRVAPLPSDRVKGSEGREGMKTLWSALAELRCRWDSRLLGGQVSLVVYEDLTLILTSCLQSVRCGFAPWEPPSGARVAGSPPFVQSLFGRKTDKRFKRKSPSPTVAPTTSPLHCSLPSAGHCDGKCLCK